MTTRRSALVLLAFALLALPGLAQARQTNLSGRSFTGENPLGVQRAEFAAAQEGMELIYQRRYAEAMNVFELAGIDFPDSPLGPLGRSIVYQARMFENYDFAFDRVYLQESAEADQRFKRVARSSSQKAWNTFLLAVHQGLQAMYQARHDEYLAAFNLAWEALENVKTVQKLAPEFHDVQLALGLYNYWRTAMTENLDYLPKFGDHREEGLKQIKLAREKGLLSPAPASLSLTISLLESKRFDEAVQEALWARQRYPMSVLNEMSLGRVYRDQKKYPEALATFQQAAAVAPDVARVWWQVGETYYKSRSGHEEGKAAFLKYIESKPMPEYVAHAYYRIGLIERRQRHYEGAVWALEQAVKADPKFKAAVTKLAEVKGERDSRSEEARVRRESRKNAEPREPRERGSKGAHLVPVAP